MKQETEKLLYSLQSGTYATRSSIKAAYDELQEHIKELPDGHRSYMHIYLHILLNSIVNELTYLENRKDIPVSISTATNKELQTMLTQGYSEHYLAQVVTELDKRAGVDL